MPIASLGRTPAMALKITDGLYQHTTFIDCILKFCRHALVHCTTEEEYYRVLVFK